MLIKTKFLLKTINLPFFSAYKSVMGELKYIKKSAIKDLINNKDS